MAEPSDQTRPWMQPYAGSKVVITGAFGFLGAHLTRILVAAGARVWAVDTDTSATRVSQIHLVAGLRGAIEVRTGDVTDRAFLRRLFSEARFDHVFHFAAFSSVVERGAMHPAETLLANSAGIVHLLAVVEETGQDLRCFVHASTDKVYGDHGGATYTEDSMEFRCEGVYEASKLASDVFARSYRLARGLPVAVVRLCNVFGPYDIDGMSFRLVPRSMATLFGSNAPPEIYRGSESHRRDYVFVDDCCRAILTLAASDLEGLSTAVFNVAGVEHVSTRDMCLCVIDAVATVVARAGDAVRAQTMRNNGYHIKPPVDNSVRAVGIQHSSGLRLLEQTGFRPQVSLRDGLEWTAESYRQLFAMYPARLDAQVPSRAATHLP